MSNLQTQVNQLFEQQTQNWPLAKQNYDALKNIEIKEFDFGTFSIRVQFNPARAVSSLAKLDSKSIEKRPCFLCAANHPAEQEGIEYQGKYDILVNPFPICTKHFTIVSKTHELQTIKGKFSDMVDLAQDLPEYIILYNGPKAGASAPDHFHFQAVNADFFQYPLEFSQEELIGKRICISETKEEAISWFENNIAELQETEEEPMMNVFCQFKYNLWFTVIFPRSVHRPTQYFAEGDQQLMVSPGAIDMAGTLVLARETDFERITAADIADIYHQVSAQ